MKFSLAIALAVFGAAQLAYPQLTGQLTGTVIDSSAAVIPDAAVTVVNESTGIKWDARTNQTGNYTVPLLQPGSYRISVARQGFRGITRSGIRLEVAQTAKVDFTLEVGAAAESIDVVDSAPLLDASTNAIGGHVASDKVANLPLKGRNSAAFVMLVPGVRATRATTGQPVLESHYQFFSVNGSRPNQNQFQLDGGNNTDLAFNSPEYSAQVESVQEFRVQTNNFSAEYANAGGAVINIVTKGGTNEIHGSLFHFFRNDALAANNFFSNAAGSPRPIFRYNQFGGTVGGPIVRNRTFYFAGYEGLSFKDPVVRTTSVPTEPQRAGDFSRTLTAAGRLILVHDPNTTRQDPNNPARYIRTPFAGNLVPQSRINPLAVALQKYFPAATSAGDPFTGLNNYFFSGPRTRPVKDFSARVDHQWNAGTMITARFSESWTTITNPPTFGETNVASPGYSRNPQHHPSALLKVTKTFHPTFFGEFVSSWARWWFDRRGLSNGFDPTTLGFPSSIAANSKALGFPSIGPGEMSGLGGFNNEHDIADRIEFKANLSKVAGRQTLKFGALYGIGKYISTLNSTATGTYNFAKGFTQGPDPFQSGPESGFGYATFLLGSLSGGSHPFAGLNTVLNQTYLGFYFQDDLKLTSKLSLSLGIRHDYEAPRTERENKLANFNYSATTTLANGTPLRGGLMYPGIGDVPRGHWNKDGNNFQPRIGIAYNLDAGTVIRAGYGVFFANSWGSGRNGNGMPQTGFTCTSTVTASLDGGLTPFASVTDPFPKGFCRPPGSAAGLLANIGQAVDMIDRDQRVPYGQSWNLNVQRKLPADVVLEIAYSGSRGINLSGTLEYNQLPPEHMALGTRLNSQVPNPFLGAIAEGPLSERTITLGQSLRPYPQFLGVSSRNATYGASTYHALFLRIERRLSKGFSVLAAYTGSKLIDDLIPSLTGFPGESFSGAPLQNFYDRRNERALASWDTPHQLVLSYVYELPFRSRGPLGILVGGWQINGITLLQSGPPLQVAGGNANGAFAGTQRPHWSGRNATQEGNISGRLGNFFDTSAFVINAPFTFGNAPRMMPNLRGPRATNFDISIFKNVQISESIRLQFRAEAFNAFNHVQFANPNTTITSTAFGRISGQQNSPRDVQLALKLLF
ncbi:MAG: carboxypeptidase regulatory-like domain-containing protein [Bryobacteraceae bacterium]